MIQAYLGLGCNLGDKLSSMIRAGQLLAEAPGISILKKSSLYETEPWGITDQPAFLNAVIKIETGLTPLELLQACQEIENSLGRVRLKNWGPRTMDIDILLYADYQLDSAQLSIPHPFIKERAFVLLPLQELDPELIFPDGENITCATAKVLDQSLKIIADHKW